jgi:protein SCO1/2
MFVVLLSFPILPLTGTTENKVTLDEPIDLPFKVDDNKSVILLYFGYVGCPDVCPASLNEIDNIYKKSKNIKGVGVYFINIIDSGGAQEYASYFNKDFIGIDLSDVTTMKLMNSLHAYKSDPLTKGGDLYHTSYLYLIKRSKNRDKFRATCKFKHHTQPISSH